MSIENKDSNLSEYGNAWLLGAAVLVFAITFALDVVMPLGVATSLAYVLPVLLTLWMPRRPVTVVFAVVGLVLTLAGYFLSPLGAPGWQAITNRALSATAIAITAGVMLVYKGAEGERRAADQRFRDIADTIPGVMWIMDPDYRVVYINAYARTLMGMGADEDITTRWVERIHPDDRDRIWEIVVDYFESVRPFEIEYRLATADGSYVNIFSRGRPFFDAKGELAGYMATGLDITDQKRSEAQLRDTAAFLSHAQEVAAIGSWVWEPSSGDTQWSDQMYRIVGVERDDWKGSVASFVQDIVHPDDREAFADGWAQLLETKQAGSSSYRIIRPDGEIRFVQAECEVILDDNGEILRLVGTTQDVTQQRLNERELRDRRDLLAQSEELALIGSWIWHAGSKTPLWSDGMYALAGRERGRWAPTVGNIYRDVVHPDDLEQFSADWERLRQGEDVVSEFRVRTGEGRVRVVRETRALTFDDTGVLQQVVGATCDITEERAAAHALEVTGDRLNHAERVARLGHTEWDVRTNVEVWSDGLYRLLGYEPGEIEPGRDAFAACIIDPEDRARLVSRRSRVGSGLIEPGADYRIRRKDGVERDVQVTGQVFKDADGNVERVFATAQDVTELRAAELALRESEERFELAARGANDGLWDWPDVRAQELWISPRCYELLGFEPNEFELTLDNYFGMIHPDDRQAVRDALDAHLEGRTGYDAEYRLQAKDGAYRWFRARGAATTDESGRAVRMAGSIQDIDARRHAELELAHQREQLRSLAAQASLIAEKERRRFGAELHDRTVQNLGITKVKLGALRSVAEAAGAQEEYRAVADLVDATIDDARALLSEISPPVLTELGFEAAVDWLAEKTEGQYGVQCTVSDDGESRILDEDAQLVLFQTVRELLANVGKHAGAESAHVRISGGSTEVVVRVEDDGVGFEAGDVPERAIDDGGYGLFSIRERLRMLGGVLQIDSRPDAGTAVTVSVPIRH